MLKDILIKTSELINRDDIIMELKSNVETTSESLRLDISRLISYYNYTIEKLCREYFKLTKSQVLTSDSFRKISILNLDYEPIKILKITSNGNEVSFSEYTNYILVPASNKEYEVYYSYLPDIISDLKAKPILPNGVSEKIVCYGIASEFLASKNLMIQSDYWDNKFMLEIFKSKNIADKKLKQRFIIWKPKL